MDTAKPIRLSAQATENMHFRGADEREIVDAIRSSTWSPADQSRFECRQNFPFNQD